MNGASTAAIALVGLLALAAGALLAIATALAGLLALASAVRDQVRPRPSECPFCIWGDPHHTHPLTDRSTT